MATRILAQQAANDAARMARRAARGARKTVTRAAKGVLGLAGERMSKVDTAWLRMDSPTNLMMIVGVWTLKPGIGYDELCRRIEDTLVKYSRFHQRVVEDAAGASWVEHPVNVREHVLREKLPRHRKDELHTVLQQRVGELAVLPLDRNKPLWEIHLIEDYDGGSALVFRIHHCIADGIALMSVTMSIVDGGPPPPERGGRRKPEGTEEWIAQALVKPLAGILTKALDSAGDGAAKSFALLRGPGKGVSETLEIARVGYQVLADAASLILMDDDTKTRLKGKPGGVKRVAWCPPLPLDEVKAIGRALNCSVNDVLLSCVAGAIGGYLRACGDDTRGAEIRAMVPVNLRPLEEAHKLGNRFGLAPLVLPIGIENPVERVYEVRRRMRALKDSTQPFLAFVVLAFAGLMIKPVQDAILDMFGRKTTAVMTNVPGPRQKLKFLGSNLEQSMFWVPQSGDVGMGVSVLSYGDGVQFGLIADISLCPDPQAIIDGFEPEFAKLSLVTLMLPWGEGQL